MVLADMANPPEHDFAPTWLKIPTHQQQSSKPPHVNYSSHGARPQDEHHDRYKSRHYSTDSQYGYGRSPTPDQFGFRGRDEHRILSSASNRHHSVDSLPWDPDPTTHWNLSQFNGNSSSTYATSGYPRRGSSVPRNGHQQYSNNGRFDGSGFASSRGQYQQGKPAATARQRYNSGPRTGYSEREDNSKDTPTKDEEQREGSDDAGKESDNKSALSNQDFPSLSGTGDDVETSSTIKKSIPPGAWENPPGTNTKVISGRKVQLIKKSIPSTSETKSSPRTIAPSSTSAVNTPAGSKVVGHNGSAGQTSKVLVSANVSSSVVLKSMTSVTPMVFSRNKDSSIRSAPVPSSRISPVPIKLSPVPILNRSTPIEINPSPVNKAPTTKPSTQKSPVSNSPVSNAATPAPKPSIVSSSSASQEVTQITADVSKADSSTDSSLPRVTSAGIASEPVFKDFGKKKQPSPKSIIDASVSMTLTKPTEVTKVSSTITPCKTSVSKIFSHFSSKLTSITNMSSTITPAKTSVTYMSSVITPAKPTSVTNMSSTITPAKPTSFTNMSSAFTPAKTSVTYMSSVITPAKPTSVTNMSSGIIPAKRTSIINMSSAITTAKPTSITNMSSAITPAKPTSIINMSSAITPAKPTFVTNMPSTITSAKPTSITNMSLAITPAKPTSIINMSSAITPAKPTFVTNMPSTITSAKPTSITNMSLAITPAKPTSIINMSSTITSAKPTSITNMSSAITSAKPMPNTNMSLAITPAKPTSIINMSSAITPAKPTSVTNMSSAITPAKPTSVTNMSSAITPAKPTSNTNMSLAITPAKPTSITNMSSTLNSKPTPTATRLAVNLNRPTPVGGRSAPVFGRPSPVSSTRSSVTIMNRQRPGPTGTSSPVPVSLRSGPTGSLNNRKEKSVTPVNKMKLLTKELPSSLPTNTPTPTPTLNISCPSPTTLKPKKGDKLVFLNQLRRSSNGDLSQEVCQNNVENLREKEGNVKMNGSTSQPKTILKREYHDIKTNGIDIHNDFTAIEKGSEEDNMPNFYPVFSPVKDVPDMSGSLEAEKRLLQEMGWHEHSDNEEGYAPLTEDELKEFKKRSQQVKKNGLTRALPATWNSASLPICSMAQVCLDDGFTSSDSDSSDEQG